MVLETVEDGVFEFGGDADRADALDVGVAADGHESGTGAADHAAQEREVGDGLDVLDAVGVVGDAHGPAEDGVFGAGETASDRVDLLLGDAAFGVDFFPGGCFEVLLERWPTVAGGI